MNKRVQIILVSAFLIAALCSYAVYRLVGARMAATHTSTTQVIVALRDIKLGTVLQDKDLGTLEVSGTAPKGAILNRQEVIGRGAISDIFEGEPVLQSRLAPVGAGGGMAATIKPGMRACAIKVDEVVGVAGFVTPGMHVDVLISGNPPNASASTEGPKVRTLLQNIEVLSAGTDIQRDNDGKPQQVQVVNLLVTPEQAESLSLASNQTKIQLVLRNPLDTAMAQTSGTAVASLFQDKNTAPVSAPRRQVAAAPRPAPAEKVFLVQVFNGSKRSDQKFVGNGEEKQ